MSLRLLDGSEVRFDAKKCASGVEITRNLRKNFAKELQIFQNFGAGRKEKLTVRNNLAESKQCRFFLNFCSIFKG